MKRPLTRKESKDLVYAIWASMTDLESRLSAYTASLRINHRKPGRGSQNKALRAGVRKVQRALDIFEKTRITVITE